MEANTAPRYPMIHRLPPVRSDSRGFECLAQLASATNTLFAEELTLDLEQTSFFDANMAAPLGSVLAGVGDNLNIVKVSSPRSAVEKILRRNGFLTNFWYRPLADRQRTTMPFRRFRLTDEGAFEEYVRQQLRDRGMPTMTAAASRAFKRKVFEVYQNATIHSESGVGVFACGQFFPKLDRLKFTVSDAGIGIRESVRRYFKNERIGSIGALKWALGPNHTTKSGPQPGGLGLGFLKQFSELNGGRIQIASRFAFYEFEKGKERFIKMAASFPGTAVTIEVNTADESQYALADEVSAAHVS